jgi:hypothetical protein
MNNFSALSDPTFWFTLRRHDEGPCETKGVEQVALFAQLREPVALNFCECGAFLVFSAAL